MSHRRYRDSFGIPHVRADSVLELATAQGLVTGGDRSWQLEYQRRRATGTTAEVFGEPGLAWDRLARRTMLIDTAQRSYEALSEEARSFVAAYVEGLNAGLRADGRELTELGLEPQPWPEWMPLAVFHAQHVLFAGLGGLLWRRQAEAVLGADAVLLSHEGPVASGSNAWAVGGSRTASGRPLIGGDPHRVIESPGVYMQVRLVCDDPTDSFDVLGFAFPGVPGVQHFAHAGDVAWAITNAMADYQDVSDELVEPTDVVIRRTETILVRDNEPVTVEVIRTPRGVVFEPGLSLRDAATELGDLGFEALLPLLRARTVDDVDRALDHWVEPVNNAVIADVDGVVRYRIAGRVPTRSGPAGLGGPWIGWLDPVPRHDVPPSGHVVTANERRGAESDAIGREFAPPYRAERLHGLIGARDDLAPGDFASFHNDTYLATVPLLGSLLPGEFDDFDGHMDADSEAAGRFAAWRSALVDRIVSEPVFSGFRNLPAEHQHDVVFDPWLNLTSRIALALPALVAAGSPFGIDLPALARAARDDVANDAPRTWGETHVATPVHAFETMGRAAPHLPRLPVSGDSDCVRCTGSYPAQTDECYRGSVARYVWDLADRCNGGWVVPTGAAGDPDSAHHHDQLQLWAEGELAPIVTEWDALTEETTGETP